MYRDLDLNPTNTICAYLSDGREARNASSYPAAIAPAAAFAGLIDTVSHFSSLEQGWDGYGARSISAGVAANAISTLAEMASLGGTIPPPVLSPEVAGTVSFRWQSHLGEAYLELGETRYSGYAETHSGKEYYFQGDARTMKKDELLTIYERLFSSGQATSVFLYKMDADNCTQTVWALSFS